MNRVAQLVSRSIFASSIGHADILLTSAAVDVFYAIPLRGSKEDWLNKQLKPWEAFSRGEPSYTDVPGRHYTLMDFDHAPCFQKIFRSRLEARGL